MIDTKSTPSSPGTKVSLHSVKSSGQLNTEEFYEICRSQLKVCKNNSFLIKKTQNPLSNAYESGSSFIESKRNEERVLKMIADRKEKRENELLSPRFSNFVPNVQDCLNFLILGTDSTKSMISSYEINFCKKNFISVISSNPKCHEAFFGLARLSSYEGRFIEAWNYINQAISLKSDELYLKWSVIISLKCHRPGPASTGNLTVFCCFRPSHLNQEQVLLRLSHLPDSIESLWSYMELSRQGAELEAPEYYASKIKDMDKYFGYLAWSDLYIQTDSKKGVSLLKELIKQFPCRPEAYTKLWKHYYFTSKNYELAEDTASEAFLRVTDYAFNHYYVLFCLYCAKSYFKTGKLVSCLQLLQKKFLENFDFPIFLYQFGRLACKSEVSSYIPQSIGALKEFSRLCPDTKQGCVYYWLAKAYLQLRQHIESYKYITKALNTLDSNQIVKKENLRKWAFELKLHIVALKQAESQLKQKFSPQVLENCMEIMENIKTYHRFSAALLNAKILWVSGNRHDSIEKLKILCDQGGVRKSSYTLLFKYLRASHEFILLEKSAFEMIRKCNFSTVPTELWVTGNLWYAKALVKNCKPVKAILILKSIAKIFTPMPYLSLPFTRTLQRACTVQQLKDPSTVNFHVYESYRHSFSSARELSSKLIDDQDAPVPEFGFSQRRLGKTLTQGIEKFQKFFVYSVGDSQDDLENIEIIPQEKNEDGFNGISVYSNPKFLYLIGKYCLKFQIMINDGICALKDYMEIIKLRKQTSKAAAKLAKSENVLKLLGSL